MNRKRFFALFGLLLALGILAACTQAAPTQSAATLPPAGTATVDLENCAPTPDLRTPLPTPLAEAIIDLNPEIPTDSKVHAYVMRCNGEQVKYMIDPMKGPGDLPLEPGDVILKAEQKGLMDNSQP